jgi:hypothetical protein
MAVSVVNDEFAQVSPFMDRHAVDYPRGAGMKGKKR